MHKHKCASMQSQDVGVTWQTFSIEPHPCFQDDMRVAVDRSLLSSHADKTVESRPQLGTFTCGL
jgi:hypothetical protein